MLINRGPTIEDHLHIRKAEIDLNHLMREFDQLRGDESRYHEETGIWLANYADSNANIQYFGLMLVAELLGPEAATDEYEEIVQKHSTTGSNYKYDLFTHLYQSGKALNLLFRNLVNDEKAEKSLLKKYEDHIGENLWPDINMQITYQEYMARNTQNKSYRVYETQSQLAYAIYLIRTGKNLEAQTIIHTLQKNKMFEEGRGWLESFSVRNFQIQLDHSLTVPSTQLLAVMYQLESGDVEDAKASYKELKESPYFNVHNEWYSLWNDSRPNEIDRGAALLDLLIRTKFYKLEAKSSLGRDHNGPGSLIPKTLSF